MQDRPTRIALGALESPRARAAAVALALAAAAVGCLAIVGDRQAVWEHRAHWWYFVGAFLVAERAVAHIEIRRQAQSLSLSEAALVLGLLFLNPIALVAARVAGAGLAMAIRRLSPLKFVFNLVLFAAEAACAALLFHYVSPASSEGPVLWLAAGASVLVAGLLGSYIVGRVVAMFDRSAPTGLIRGVLDAQAMTAALSISVAVVGAEAIRHSATNLVYLCVIFVAVLILFRMQASITQRASNMESVSKFMAELFGLETTSSVTETALRQIAGTMRARRAAFVPLSGDAEQGRLYRVESDEVVPAGDDRFFGALEHVTSPMLLSEIETTDHMSGGEQLPLGAAAPLLVGDCRFVLVVWDRSTEVGNFASDGLTLFEAMVAQTQVAMDRALMIDRLQFDAHHDALTGLPNRHGFADRVELPLGAEGALFVLDLDRFKEINDTLGHPTGDRALEIISERLGHVVADDATLARLGGDEFAVFVPGVIGVEKAGEVAESVAAVIEQPIAFDDLSLHVGASIGIALAPQHGVDLTTLMKHADSAMYQAKRRQIGWQFYRQEDDSNDPRRLELVSALRQAIASRELDVHYQPKVRIHDRSIVGVEALARWTHPRFGEIPADEFIGLAEGAGMMRDLTDAILERTVADMANWRRLGQPISVAVNLSTRNLLDDTLPGRVQEMLAKDGVPPELLSFEITETSMMVDRDRVVALLSRLHAAGIRIAIDDYGTGYSSLAYLRELPVDELKIDRSFVANVDIDPQNEVIVRSTINLAQSLGLSVVAEGVSREAEWQTLTALGCDLAQGFLIARPLPVETFDLWRAGRQLPVVEPGVTRVRPDSRMLQAAHE